MAITPAGGGGGGTASSGFGTGLSGRPAGTPSTVQKAPTKKPAKKAPATTGRGAAPSSAPRSPNQSDRSQQAGAKPAGNQISQILDFGMQFRGTPYAWGGAAPGGFDCSGLLFYMFGQAGVKIPRTSGEQASAGVAVSAKDARPGDLIALDWSSRRSGNSAVDHIGVYLGNGKMLVAPRTGDVVKVQSIDLTKAATIRRVMPESAYQSMKQSNGGYVYAPAANVTAAGAASPSNSGPAAGGGDPGNNPSGSRLPGAVASGGMATPGNVNVAGNMDVFGFDAKLDPEEAMAQYGYIAELARSVPDIQKVLSAAIAGGWSVAKFQAELQGTAWWKATTDSQRQVQVLKATNPGEYKRQRQQRIDAMVIQSRNLGVTIDNKKLEALADKAMSLNWSAEEQNRYLAADVKVKNTGNTGAVAVTVDSLKEQAEQYGVPMSTATLQTWTTQILRGMVPQESFNSYLREQAKSLFPGMAGAIDAGITVQQYTAPYRELTAEILEMNPAQIRMSDPHIQKALYNIGKDGSRTQMTLSEYQTYLRGTDGFRKTRRAQESAASLTNTLTDIFGATA